MSMDIAFPRNEKDWFEELPDEINCLLDKKFYYGHKYQKFTQSDFQVETKLLKEKLLHTYNIRGAEYPAEHNVGHEYFAKPSLIEFYKKLDPTNTFNTGIGQTSKLKNWK